MISNCCGALVDEGSICSSCKEPAVARKSTRRARSTKSQKLCSAGASITGVQKNKVILSQQELSELRELIASWGNKAPRWMMMVCKVTRPRRSYLMTYLYESGVDEVWCEHSQNDDHFANVLHRVYHKLELSK